MSTDTDQRLSRLESRLAEHDRIITALKAYAKLHPAGRTLLKVLGLT